MSDFCMFDMHIDEVREQNVKTQAAVRKYWGLPESGNLEQLLREKFSDFWTQVQRNRQYAMAIMTHPLKRAKKSVKRTADGTMKLQSLSPLPSLPCVIRKMIDSYIFP